MQRPDGAVYHKLSGRYWPDIGATPDFDRQPRFIYGISTADTGKFAATMAIVARVFAQMDPDLAERAAQAAKKAWDFLAENEFVWDHSGFDDQGSGAYGTTDDWWDRVWAALELAVLFGDDSYVSAVINADNIFKRPYQPVTISWSDAALLGLFHYARAEGGRPELRAELTKMITELADKYLTAVKNSGYRYTLMFDEFAWASNKEALSRGIAMLMAAELTTNPQYRTAALAQLDFVLGFNPLSKCFVAGLGTKSVQSPHHRVVVSSSKSVPGLLVGGPNNQAESGVEPRDQGPFSYRDATPSYSSNETAIDYNAALVFVASAFATTTK
jgi:endoglucanase